MRDGGKRHYKLSYEPAPALFFWQKVSSTLELTPGAKIWVFVRIFAPTKFNDQVQFAWEYDDAQRGWVEWGRPFSTTLGGGSEEGYRTYANTTPSKPGDYRVRVLTADGREIGRKTVTVKTRSEPVAVQTVTD